MTTVAFDDGTLRVRLTRREKVAGLLRDLNVPLSAVRAVTVVADGLDATQGLRAPGLAIPGRRIGTWRRGGQNKTVVAVRRGHPALWVELSGQPWSGLLLDGGASPRRRATSRESAVSATSVMHAGTRGPAGHDRGADPGLARLHLVIPSPGVTPPMCSARCPGGHS